MKKIKIKKKSSIKIALGIEYKGKNFYGWQKQKNKRSIQNCLEKSLSKITSHKVNVFCAGRTDSGVHAIGQVVHFETNNYRKNTAWTLGLNKELPNDIAIRWAKKVPNTFHARFSAISRQYYYIIYNNRLRPALLHDNVTHIYHPLNIERMKNAAKYLIGENDFSSFRSIYCQSSTPYRNLIHIKIIQLDNYIFIDVKANSFLYHMVRIIVGTLIEIGSFRKKVSWIREILMSKDRHFAGPTVKPNGLYLVFVEYPIYFGIPNKIKKINLKIFNF